MKFLYWVEYLFICVKQVAFVVVVVHFKANSLNVIVFNLDNLVNCVLLNLMGLIVFGNLFPTSVVTALTATMTFEHDLNSMRHVTNCFVQDLVILRVTPGGLAMDINVAYVELVQHEIVAFCEFSRVFLLCIG